jgi:hypothetical protein
MFMLDRNKLVEGCWKKVASLSNVSEDSIVNSEQELLTHLDADRLSFVIGTTKSIVNDRALLAIRRYKRDGSSPWPVLHRGLSTLYWLNELDLADSKRESAGYDYGDMLIYSRCFFHAMMLQARADSLADWIAPYMVNVMRHGGWFDEDTEFGIFYTLLLEAQLANQWIGEDALDQRISPEVATLLRALPDPAALKVALVHYCDWRLARARGYRNFSGTGKKSEYVFGAPWWGVFPFELFAIQAIFRRCTGGEISLLAEHPLLQGALMQPPPLHPLLVTDETRRLQTFIEKTFADGFEPLSPVQIIC